MESVHLCELRERLHAGGRSRHLASFVVLAVVVTAAGLVARALQDSDAPGSTPAGTDAHALADAHLPQGAPARAPYWLDGILQVGNDRVRTTPPVLLSAAGHTLVVTETSSGLHRIQLVTKDHLATLQTAGTVPALSPDGRYAAWELPHRGSIARVVLWDLSTGSQVATQTFHSTAHCCDAPSLPVGVDATGRVYVWDGGTPLVWDHASHSVSRIVGGHGDLSGASRGGPVFVARAGSVYGALVPAFRERGGFPARQGSWSPASTPNGESVAYVSPQGVPTVLDAKTKARTLMRLPAGDYVVSAWEDADHVLVAGFEDGRTYVIRCDAHTGGCAMVTVFPARVGPEDLVLPNPD